MRFDFNLDTIVETHVKKIHENPRRKFQESSTFIDVHKTHPISQPGPSNISPNIQKSPKPAKSEDESVEMQKKNAVLFFDDESEFSDDPSMRPRQTLVGWDSFRSRTMAALMILFFIWIILYFPLMSIL